MDDPLLARARLLVKIGEDAQAASAAVTASLTKGGAAPTKTSPVVSPNRKSNALPSGATSFVDSPTHKRYDPAEEGPSSPESRVSADTGAAPSGVTRLKVSVIKGSSLVSCLSGGDVRTFLKRGSTIEIEGVEYNLSKKVGSEWGGNRIELERDYAGDTKLNAFMSVKNTAKRSPKKVRSIEPIPSSEISEALRGLDDIIPLSMRRDGASAAGTGLGEVRRTNMAKSMNIHHAKEKSHASATDTGNTVAPGTYIGANYDYETHVPSAVDASPPRFPVSKKTGHASPPKLSAMDEPVDRDVAAYQSYTEKYSAQARSSHLESQRKAAMARANKRMKVEMEERRRKEEQDQKLKDAKREAMERKAVELRERTKQRVAKLNAAKKHQSEEKQAKEQWDQARKQESQAVAKSDAYKERMVALRKETAERMRKKEMHEQASKLKAKLEMEKKLTEISLSRRNHDQRAPASFGAIHAIRPKNDASSVASGASRAAAVAAAAAGGERKSRTASPSSLRRPRAVGNGRYSIDDADYSAGVAEEAHVAAQPVYVSPEKSASASPAWLPAEEDEYQQQAQSDMGRSFAPRDTHRGTPPLKKKPVPAPASVTSPPRWEAGAGGGAGHGISYSSAAGADADEAEWSDDSLGDEGDAPPAVPASADRIEPLGAQRSSADRDRDYMAARGRVKPVSIDIGHSLAHQSVDEMSAITLGSMLSPGGKNKGNLHSASRYSNRIPPPSGGASVGTGTRSTRKSFKPLKPISLTREFIPVPKESEGVTDR